MDQKQPFPGFLEVKYSAGAIVENTPIPKETDGIASAFIGYQQGPCSDGASTRCYVLEITNQGEQFQSTIGIPAEPSIIDSIFGNGGLRDHYRIWVRVRANQANERGVSNVLRADINWTYAWEE